MIEKKERLCYKHTPEIFYEEQIIMPCKVLKIQEPDAKPEMGREMKMERYRLYAVIVCLLTVLLNFFMGVAAFICASVTDSSAGYAFALDCLLDVTSAALVLWRYYGSKAEYSRSREQITCVSLGVLFILSAIGILSKAVYDLVEQTLPGQLVYIFILAGLGTVFGPLLGVAKYNLHKKLDSESLLLDALNSVLSSVLAMMITVSDILYYHYPIVWCLDPVISIVVSIILIYCGIRVIREKKRKDEDNPLLP